MSKFKVGDSEFKISDKVRVTASDKFLRGICCNVNIKSGGEYPITNIGRASVELDGYENGNIRFEEIELILRTHKWSIYNNDLPWEKLSNKKKGELLLAAHSEVKFFKFGNITPTFSDDSQVYVAIKPEPAPAPPTMEELFVADWHETDVHLLKDFSEHMIAKGWTKPC